MKTPKIILSGLLALMLVNGCKKGGFTTVTPFQPQPVVKDSFIVNPNPLPGYDSATWAIFYKETDYDRYRGGQYATLGADSSISASAELGTSAYVFFNGQRLSQIPFQAQGITSIVDLYSYTNIPNSAIAALSNWDLKNFDGMADFSYKDAEPLPAYIGPIPQTIDHTKGFTLNLGSNLINTGSVRLSITSNDASFSRSYTLSADAGTITFSPVFLTVPNTPAHYKLTIRLQKSTAVKINYRYCNFVTDASYDYDVLVN